MERLVEREGQLAQLLDAVQSAEGKVVFLQGEAGSGKTSLIRAFRAQLDHRYDVRLGRCEPLSTPTPLGPLYEMLPTFSDEVNRLLHAGKDRAALFAAVFAEIAAGRSVTVFDDAHYADEATVDLVRYLGRRIRDTSATLVCAYRPGEIDRTHPLRAVPGELGDAGMRVELGALSVDGVRVLAEGVDVDPIQVYSASGGNPLFVTQLLAHPGEDLPVSLADAVISLAQSLPPAAWELLDIMGLAPDGLPVRLLDDIGVGAELDRAVSVGLLEVDGDRVRCRHDLIRLALESNIAPATRLRIHRRLLDALEGRATSAVDVSVLAHHAVEAGSAEEAIGYSIEAAQRAASDGSHREAAAHYANALRFEGHMDEVRRLETRKAYSYELYLTGELEEAWVQARWVHDHAADDGERGRALRWMSRLAWFLGRREDALRDGHLAVEILEQAGSNRHELAYAYSNLSQLAMLDDNADDVHEWGEKALDLARADGDLEVVVHALNNIGTAVVKRSGDSRDIEESLEIALANGLSEHAARAFTNLSYNLLWQRQTDRAEEVLQRGLAFCEDEDLETWWWYMRGPQARLLIERGEWDRAEGLIRAILDTQSAPLMRHDALVARARLLLRHGGDGVQEAVDAAIETGRGIGEYTRLVLAASVAAEAAWSGHSVGDDRWITQVLDAAMTRGDRWAATELAFWHLHSGTETSAEGVAEPLVREIAGDYEGSRAAWAEAGSIIHGAIAQAWSRDPEAIRSALETLADVGAHGSARSLRSALRDLGVEGLPRGPIGSTRANPAGLTARQLDVLRCLDAGMSNSEIAEELYISPKTAEHHVSAIITKLGVTSRSSAVAAARERGILD